MKHAFLCLLFIFPVFAVANENSISGTVNSGIGCSKKAMVWLSLDKENYQERLLLMHTEVPQGGTFRFYVVPGSYQVRVSDEAGCEVIERIAVKSGDHVLALRPVKK